MAARDVTDGGWRDRFDRMMVVVPYWLLGGATLFALIQPDQTATDRLVTLGLVVVAAAWMYLMLTRRPREATTRTGPMAVYYFGMLALAAVLTAHSVFFVAFVATGLIHAFALLPTRLAVAGVLLSSMVMYGLPGRVWLQPTVASISGFVFLVLLQSTLTSFFSYTGMKLDAEHVKRQELVTELEAALEENAGLHAQLLTSAREAGKLDERQRMAGEIHDTLAQGLTGIITQLEAAERAAGRPADLHRHLEQARALARENLAEARRSVQALRPEQLDEAGLPGALAGLAASQPGDVRVEVTGEPRPLLPELEHTLFRTAQEALTNVAKHAQASKAVVTLSYLDDTVLLDVRDDGIGFDPEARPDGGRGFGLEGMRQRLRRVAGDLEIESRPGEGTAIGASVPAIGPSDNPADSGVADA
jgi:signal transduction histidine kinase